MPICQTVDPIVVERVGSTASTKVLPAIQREIRCVVRGIARFAAPRSLSHSGHIVQTIRTTILIESQCLWGLSMSATTLLIGTNGCLVLIRPQ